MAGSTRWVSDRLLDGEAASPSGSTSNSASAAAPGSAASTSTAGGGRRPRLLLLCDWEPDNAATVIDHIEAIRAWSAMDVFVLPMLRDIPDQLDLDAFDGLAIHYNLVMAFPTYLSPLARWRIAQFRGVKAAFIQDEYRFVDDTVHAMRTMGINVLFTCVPQSEVEKVYPRTRIPSLRRTRTVLTGYVPDELLARPVRVYDDRPLDVSYRARHLPAWLGDLAQEKWQVAERFAADAPSHGLSIDVSTREEDRIYGDAWVEFVSRSKATLGVESGASVFDFDGSIEAGIRAYTAQHPDATYAELHERFMRDVDGTIRLNQISPRSFEAAALGTLMVMYPGEYSGILEAGRHYMVLEKDHANMAEVVSAIRDRATWERITAAARTEVAEDPQWSFRSVGPMVDEAMELTATATRPVDPVAFSRIADRSRATILELRPPARRPGRVEKAARVATRAARVLTPSPAAIVAATPGDDRPRADLRRQVQALRSAAWWLLRPGTLLPVAWLRRRPLLHELGRLALLQGMGGRAWQAGAASPFVIVADRAAGEVRVELATVDATRAGVPAEPARDPALAGDLRWVRTVRLALADPFLVPAGAGDPQGPLPELTRLAAADPAGFRRVLAGPPGWCTILGGHDA